MGLYATGLGKKCLCQGGCALAHVQDASQSLRLALRHEPGAEPALDALWPFSFELTLTITLSPGRLLLALQVHNTGSQSMPFTMALHSYLAVQDVQQLRLEGLAGLRYWDALADTHPTSAADWRYSGAFDAVFPSPPCPLVLRDAAGALEITQSPNLANTVVWNPGPTLSAQLADMPDDGYQHMLCVEAAQIDTPVDLAAGAHWLGWQQLRAL